MNDLIKKIVDIKIIEKKMQTERHELEELLIERLGGKNKYKNDDYSITVKENFSYSISDNAKLMKLCEKLPDEERPYTIKINLSIPKIDKLGKLKEKIYALVTEKKLKSTIEIKETKK